MTNMKNQNELVKLIKEFKGEIRENEGDIKRAVKYGQFQVASHLNSVNGCLDYVIHRMEMVVVERKKA
jgi:hypothetical protein